MDSDDVELRKYVAEIARLHSQAPDPTSLLLLKGHALIDDWLERHLKFANSIIPLKPDNPKLNELSPDFKALYSSPRTTIPLNLNFIGKLREVEKLRVHSKEVINAIERLNKVRNDYAHDFDTRITRRHIEFILQPLIQDPMVKIIYEEKKSSFVDDFSLLEFCMVYILTPLLFTHGVIVKIGKILQ